MKVALVSVLIGIAFAAGCRDAPTAPGPRVPRIVELGDDGAAALGGAQVDDAILAVTLPDGRRVAGDEGYARLELAWVEAGRRPFAMTVGRRGLQLELELPAGAHGLTIEPPFADGSVEPGEEQPAACWNAVVAAEAAAQANEDAETWAAFVGDHAACEAAGAEHRLWAKRRAGTWAVVANRIPEAAEAFAAAQALAERTSGMHELVRADAELLAAETAFMLSEAERSERLLERGIARVERVAPDSPLLSAMLLVLGKIERNRSRLDSAEALLHRALDHGRTHGGGPRAVGDVLNELGIVADRRGDLALAEQRYREALEHYPADVGESVRGGVIRMGMGIVAWKRGHLEVAEAAFDAAQTIFHARVPDSPYEGWSLQNLGLVAHDRGDLAGAEAFHRRSLEVRERAAPESIDVAMALNNLGATLIEQERFEEAEAAFTRGREIIVAQMPGSQVDAGLLGHIGQVAASRGEIERALDAYARARAMIEGFAPGSLFEAGVLIALGRLERDRGRLAAARELIEGSLAIRTRLAPATASVAQSYHALGTVERRAGDRDRALAAFESAIEALEAQRGRIGGGEEQSGRFSARYAEIYEDYTDLLLELGRRREALDVQERFRVRGLLALMAQRELALDLGLTQQAGERRREVDRAYERAQEELSRLDGTDDVRDRVTVLVEELRELRRERVRLDAELRATDPRRASFHAPLPLDSAGVAASLERGTRLVLFDVGATRTHLFVVAPDGTVEVATRPLGRAVLAERVERFRELLQLAAEDPAFEVGQRRIGAELYADLLAPLEHAFTDAERLLILRDGPLYRLPFAALPSGERYLLERHALHFVASASLYDALGAVRAQATPASLIAFGDPQPESATRALRRGNEALGPLPFARSEARRIAEGFPGARVLLGKAASEANAKRLLAGREFVHFACHARVDERFPLDSFLQLSAGEEENGRLQAWEILSDVELDADLVTLSTCDSALGAELGGEGIVGLTWAFQYAGARSIVASLWPVADRSTEQLMRRFYERLRQGLPRDEALREAQLSMLSQSPPFYWAAFQLEGRRD